MPSPASDPQNHFLAVISSRTYPPARRARASLPRQKSAHKPLWPRGLFQDFRPAPARRGCQSAPRNK